MADWENVQPDYYCYTNNYNASSITYKQGICWHHMAGNLTGEGCVRVWQTRQASAHYAVESTGRICQMVDDCNYAWHAGNTWANTHLIGIETADDCTSPWHSSDAAVESLAHLTAALCKYYGWGRPQWGKNVFGHSDFQATSCPQQFAVGGSQHDYALRRSQEWYDAMVGGTSAPAAGNTSTPSTPSTYTGEVIPCHYALRTKNGSWLPEVTNFNNSNNDGYAGNPFGEHDYFYIYADRGSFKYRVHVVDGYWLDWVYKADKDDLVNGAAGIDGVAIDAVEIYYYTPDGEEYKQAWYRSQTTQREGWLPVVCDDGTSNSAFTDEYAGNFSEPLDRLQVCITDGNPY